MPRAIFPDTILSPGPSRFRSLPFPYRATLTDQGGDVVAENVPVAVWPASSYAVERTGGVYTHEGEGDYAYLDELIATNRALEIEGVGLFRIIEAVGQAILPHVVLRLRSVRPGG